MARWPPTDDWNCGCHSPTTRSHRRGSGQSTTLRRTRSPRTRPVPGLWGRGPDGSPHTGDSIRLPTRAGVIGSATGQRPGEPESGQPERQVTADQAAPEFQGPPRPRGRPVNRLRTRSPVAKLRSRAPSAGRRSHLNSPARPAIHSHTHRTSQVCPSTVLTGPAVLTSTAVPSAPHPANTSSRIRRRPGGAHDQLPFRHRPLQTSPARRRFATERPSDPRPDYRGGRYSGGWRGSAPRRVA